MGERRDPFSCDGLHCWRAGLQVTTTPTKPGGPQGARAEVDSSNAGFTLVRPLSAAVYKQMRLIWPNANWYDGAMVLNNEMPLEAVLARISEIES